MIDKKPIKINYANTNIEETIEPELKASLDKVTFDEVTASNMTNTIRNIRKNVTAKIKSEFGITDKVILKQKADAILRSQGLHEDNFDFMKTFEDGLLQKINDVSIDDNSNKGQEKSIKGYLNDIKKPVDKLIGFDLLYRTLKDLYGRSEAKRLTANMYDYSLGLADSSSITVPYCYALDTTKLVTMGRQFGTLHSSPCNRTSSYISVLFETVHQISNHLAGAVALSTIMMDIAHLMIYKQRITLDELKSNTRGVRKRLENEFQQFIHSVNHNSRNGSSESPFTNISIFDKVKLHGMVSDDNFGWYFPNKKAVSTDLDLQDKMSDEEFKSYVVDYISEVQNVFMDFFDKGDPLQNGSNYKFPVATQNIAKDENNNILDPEFVKSICQRDISRYNIFCSPGEKIASCCRLISSKEMMDDFSGQVNSLGGGGATSMGSHRVVTINFQRIALEAESLEEYYNILKLRIEDAAKILKAHKLLILKLKEKGYQPFISNGFINFSRMFSTFGILGTYEANRTLRSKFEIEKDRDLVKEILTFFNSYTREMGTKYNLVVNQEQIPAESMAVRFASIDKTLFDLGDDYYPLYANQHVPLTEDATIFERITRSGQLDATLSGGSITHLNVDGSTTYKQNMKLIEFAVKANCEHFAINKCYTICNECNEVVKSKVDKCPKCNSNNVDYMLRIIGYFTRVSGWNKTRREYEFPKRVFKSSDTIK